ncbi:MAG: GNAT family N-acetyltransferase [Acidobacteriia bacterium]|nr:GNAT family N-acetyltransferase [Terriglobia bacterium]
MFEVSSANTGDVYAIQQIYTALRRPKRTRLSLDEYLVARGDGQVVGCAGVQLITVGSVCEGYLYGLAVRKEHQRKGIGAALTEARIDRVRKSHGTRATALAMFWNVAFFRGLGFATIRRSELSPAILALDDFVDARYRRSAVMVRSVVL